MPKFSRITKLLNCKSINKKIKNHYDKFKKVNGSISLFILLSCLFFLVTVTSV